jgi:DNA-binding protein HU-beta
MKKEDLIIKIAEDAKISKIEASVALDSILMNINQALKKKGSRVTLLGFGTFAKVQRKARKGRNPQTGETIEIKARDVVTFKAGKKFSDAI